MNQNVKEIGHLAFRVKNQEQMMKFFKEDLGLNIGFILKSQAGLDRIIYFQLNHGQFIELFPEPAMNWPDYDGHNAEGKYGYHHVTLGTGTAAIQQDLEENRWAVNDRPLYISKVTYYCNDMQKNKKFYTEVLDLDLVEENQEHVLIKVNEEQQIELLNKPHTDENNCQSHGFHHYALIVHDIEKMAEFCVNKGITLYHGDKGQNNPYTEPYVPVKHSEHSYNFWIQDFEDNEIEVMAYSEESLQVVHAAE